ncbi:MAG: nucleotidyltransferase family protein [Desulfobulbaceae bacterium]|nr:nucleotidyltransferase family protein [Desulfobulbaceae bacterium]
MSDYHLLLQKLIRITPSAQDTIEIGNLLGSIENWDTFLEWAEIYGVSGLILKRINECDLNLPEPAMLSLKGLALHHSMATNIRYEAMQQLIEHFATHGIQIAALKGLALAPLIYPTDSLRPMGDIDILVAKKNAIAAADIIRTLGFNMPERQASKYERYSHQLPCAQKKVNGFNLVIEIHHDAINQNTPGHLRFEDVESSLRTIEWKGLKIQTLGHEHMLHQVCRHLEAPHPGSILKLINVLDVVLYSEHFLDEINWELITERYPHVSNTLRCLHMLVPLSERLQNTIGGVSGTRLASAGTIMFSLRKILGMKESIPNKLHHLFIPSEWWLHLYYGVHPDMSLVLVKTIKHPITVIIWITKRLFSRVKGSEI